MKKTLFTAALIGIATLSMMAEDPATTTLEATPAEPALPSSPPTRETDLLRSMPEISPQQLDALVRFQTATASRVWGINFTVDGVIPRARRSGNPLQLINPFAPAHYGSGEDVTSIHPRTGQAEGIVLLGIRF
jgi:hypothetical protein